MYVLMRDADRRKKEASKVIQTTKQHSTPKAVNFPKEKCAAMYNVYIPVGCWHTLDQWTPHLGIQQEYLNRRKKNIVHIHVYIGSN